MLSELEKLILKVICYFDGLDRPLTLMEIFKWLKQKIEISELNSALYSEELSRLIKCQRGFYFLSGRSDLVEKRLSRYAISAAKIKRAWRMVYILKQFPWVRAIAVYSSLSFFNCEQKSDIDFFVIAQKGRVWSSRFFLNCFFKIFNLRPNQQTGEDKFCLSFLVAESDLNLWPAVDGANDYHYIFSHSQFVFLFGEDDLISRFFENNRHIGNNFPNWQPYQFGSKTSSSNIWFKKIIEIFLGLVSENFYRRVQFLILPLRVKAAVGSGKAVILSEKIIKLHYNDKRQFFNDKFKQIFERILSDVQT